MAQGPDLALVFELGGELHALPASDIFKVVEMAALAPLPLLPKPIRGITHHRGRVVTVVDLSVLMGGAMTALDSGKARVLLVDRGGRNVGLLTGPVEEIVPLDPMAGSPPVKEGSPVTRVHLHRGRALNILSTQTLLSRIQGLCKPDAPLSKGRVLPAPSLVV